MTSGLPRVVNRFKIRAFGVILVLFGAVNSVMNMATGIPVDAFDLFLAAAGAALLAFATFGKNRDTQPRG